MHILAEWIPKKMLLTKARGKWPKRRLRTRWLYQIREDVEERGQTWTKIHTAKIWDDRDQMAGELIVIVDRSNWERLTEEEVETFSYLGSIIIRNGKIQSEINERIKKTWNIYWGQRVIGISRSLIWLKTLMVNFGETWKAQLAKSTLLTSMMGPLGSFKICSYAKERVDCRKQWEATASIFS